MPPGRFFSHVDRGVSKARVLHTRNAIMRATGFLDTSDGRAAPAASSVGPHALLSPMSPARDLWPHASSEIASPLTFLAARERRLSQPAPGEPPALCAHPQVRCGPRLQRAAEAPVHAKRLLSAGLGRVLLASGRPTSGIIHS